MSENRLLDGALVSYKKYLANIPNGCQKIVEHFREGNINEGMNMILNFSEGIMWMIDLNGIAKQHGILLDLQIEKIHDLLNEINTAIENKDYVLIADLFEYELVPFFEEYIVKVG